jgi:hypothetical protein
MSSADQLLAGSVRKLASDLRSALVTSVSLCNRVDFAYVEIPYACKLLFQELQPMNAVLRIMT